MRGLRSCFAQMSVRSLVIAFVLLAYLPGFVGAALAAPVLGDVVEVTRSPQDPALNLLDRAILEQILATKPNVTLRGFALGTELSVDLGRIKGSGIFVSSITSNCLPSDCW